MNLYIFSCATWKILENLLDWIYQKNVARLTSLRDCKTCFLQKKTYWNSCVKGQERVITFVKLSDLSKKNLVKLISWIWERQKNLIFPVFSCFHWPLVSYFLLQGHLGYILSLRQVLSISFYGRYLCIFFFKKKDVVVTSSFFYLYSAIQKELTSWLFCPL